MQEGRPTHGHSDRFDILDIVLQRFVWKQLNRTAKSTAYEQIGVRPDKTILHVLTNDMRMCNKG